MRICYLVYCNTVQPNVFFKYFTEKGHDVHTFGNDCVYPMSKVTLHDLSFSKYNKTDGIQHTLKNPMITKGWKKRAKNNLASMRNIWHIRRKIKKIDPDIVHGYDAMGWGLSTALSNRGKTILTCNGSDIFRYPWESKITYRKIYYSLKKADLIHLTFPYSKDFIIDKFNIDSEKIKILSFGIDIKLFDHNKFNEEEKQQMKVEMGIGREDIVILYPKGFRNNEKQNYVNILKSFIELKKTNNKVKLIMLSYNFNNNYKTMKELIIKAGIERDVIIIRDFLTQEKISKIHSISDMHLVIPDTDQFSSSIFEGMLMGSIPVLSDLKTYKYILKNENNCFFVDQKDPQSITSKIQLIMDDLQSFKKRIVPINRDLITENYDRKYQMPKIERMYNELI